MKGMITDNAFDKAWKKPCKHCDNNKPNLKLFFRERCNDCQSKLRMQVEQHIKTIES